jgi:tetratricopeptide (TPR) repeat protein
LAGLTPLAILKRVRGRGTAAWKIIAVLVSLLVVSGAILVAPVLMVDVDEIPVEFVSRPKPDPVPRDYSGSLTCVECHREVCESYLGHPMNQAMDGMPQLRPIENLETAPFPEGKLLQYHVEKRDKRLVHHEILKSAEGKVIYDMEEPIHYVLGSGQRGRTYLLKKAGALYQSPIGWYSGVGKWDLSPGYGYPQNERFERRVGAGCLYCHAGILHTDPEREDSFIEPTFREMPISCERCHGPAKKHVDFHKQGGVRSGEVDPIVNPAKLDFQRREHICYQCHLQGEAVVPRFGRSHTDFRPGMLLDDVWTVFVSKQGVAGRVAKAVSHVEQMHASRCFQESKGEFGCTSCHDPHSKPKAEERVSFYNQRCASCHTEQDCKELPEKRAAAPANGSCIACHMPATKASDVAHTAQTDHRVLANPAAFPLDQLHEPPALTDLEVFDGAESRLPAAEIDRGKAILIANRPGATKIEDLDQILTKLLIPAEDLVDGVPFTIAAIADDKAAMHSLGFAYLVNDQRDKAIALWERILELDPEDESALALLFAQKLDLAPAEALKLSDRLLNVNPNVALSWGRRSYLLGQMGRNEESIAAGEKALSLDPRLTQVYEWLAERYSQAGQPEKALKHRETYAEFLKAAASLRLKTSELPGEPKKQP